MKNRGRRSRWHSFGTHVILRVFQRKVHKHEKEGKVWESNKIIVLFPSLIHAFCFMSFPSSSLSCCCRLCLLWFKEKEKERNTRFFFFSLEFQTNITNHHYPSPGAEVEKYYFPRRDKLLVKRQEWVGEAGKSRSCTGTFLAKNITLRVSYSFTSWTERIFNRKGKCNKRQVTEERQTITVSCSKLCCNFLRVLYFASSLWVNLR